jgi:hypothetical protein
MYVFDVFRSWNGAGYVYVRRNCGMESLEKRLFLTMGDPLYRIRVWPK